MAKNLPLHQLAKKPLLLNYKNIKKEYDACF